MALTPVQLMNSLSISSRADGDRSCSCACGDYVLVTVLPLPARFNLGQSWPYGQYFGPARLE
jgi:hypothetical protein